HILLMPLEHRSKPLPNDNLAIMDFVNSNDYSVFVNLKGSGASTPDHLHYQGQRRENFPLINNEFKKSLLAKGNNIDLYSFNQVNSGYFFEYNLEKKEKASIALGKIIDSVTEQGLSYNLFFDKNKIFIFPRTREIAIRIPDELKNAGMDKWQIAGQEMGYLFTAKYKSIFDAITPQALYNSLEDVTLEKSEKKYFDGFLKEKIKGLI
ncbi:MAG: hypothetical protein PHN56_05405, partial [Candidatus Nanoarchaeia archaeon]|nr:hypothetical protein [Candidatus Nanoarchaeia archaeon]